MTLAGEKIEGLKRDAKALMLSNENSGIIRLRSVRVHNLKSLDLDLPRDRLIVVSGVSGSGKSSLAFDTLFAEGQRRYVETFSPYIRQFLGRLDKPDADLIDGLPAAIAVSQKVARRSARATVGTVSGLQDALAMLYARVGVVVCPDCGREVKPADARDVERAIQALPEGTEYQVAFPLEVLADTNRDALAASLRAQGLSRVRVDQKLYRLDDSNLPWPEQGTLSVVIDRLKRGAESNARLRDSIETAFVRGQGRCRVHWGDALLNFQKSYKCAECGRVFLRPDPRLFRPGNPLGACRNCEGYGRTIQIDLTRIVPDAAKSLRQMAIAPWSTPAYQNWYADLLEWAPRVEVPIDRPFKLLDAEQKRLIVEGDADFAGLRGFFRAIERKAYKTHVRVFLGRWRGYETCKACKGAQLRPEALAVHVRGLDIAQFVGLTIAEAHTVAQQFQEGLDRELSRRLLEPAIERLDYLQRIGLGYLTLDRPARSLSTGEARRVTLTTALGSGLVRTLYVLDEPSIGLHPRDIDRLIEAIRRLTHAPNTVIVVDHDEALMNSADLLVDIGPGAGEAGGRLVFCGAPNEVGSATESLTADYLTGRRSVTIPHNRRKIGEHKLTLSQASGHNLKNLDVRFPLGVLCVVTGVSGSGKSTLVEETLYPALMRRLNGEYLPMLPHRDLRGTSPLNEVRLIDQSPIGRTPRSNPVTYLKAFDEIRKTFASSHEAKLRNYGAGRFSFNVDGGRCDACQGNGFQIIDMKFLSDVLVRCPSCRGRRFRAEVLEVTYRGKNIAEVLEMTAREAFGFFRNRPKIQLRLRPLLEVGLDYLRLGQPANTLSGGEAQRLKLAAALSARPNVVKSSTHSLYLLDEPTTGLHPADIARLIECLDNLVDRGDSVIVVEHSPEIMVSADWIIDLGPEAGAAGGKVVAEGTPEEVSKTDTHTGRVLRRWLTGRRTSGLNQASKQSAAEDDLG
jgi:excinuclease ABC subunit A